MDITTQSDNPDEGHSPDAESRYKNLVDNFLIALAHCRLVYDATGAPSEFEFLYINSLFGQMMGVSDVVGAQVPDVIHGAGVLDRDLFFRFVDVVRTGEPARFQYYFRAVRRWFNISAYRPERDCVIVTFDDVTEAKNAEQALRVESDRMRLAQQVAHFGVFDWHIPSGINAWSSEIAALYGRSPADFGDSFAGWRSFIHPDDRDRSEERRRLALDTGDYQDEFRCVWPDGTHRHLLARGQVYRDAHGHAERLVGINVDITDRKRQEEETQRLQAQIQHAQKLESLGVLAGGIAHDFNNLLSGVLGSAGLARMDLPPNSPAQAQLERIEKAAERAAMLTRQMLAYAGKGKFFTQPIDISRLVEEMTSLLGTVISKKATLRKEFADELPTIDADPAQVQQVVMNLITNASDALGADEGRITIRTGVVQVDDEYTRSFELAPELAPGPYVFLDVSDTGCGMDEATRSKMFDPFFTTKFTGRGLGMAAVLGIIRGHKGSIKVYSEVGHGTTVRVLLPANRSPQEMPPSAPPLPVDEWRASGRVLIIDDEETVRSVASATLRSKGFQPLTAAEGRSGITLFEIDQHDFAFVLLDMTMPTMDGPEVCRHLQRIDPNVKIVLMSGYSESHVLERCGDLRLAGFLQKPFRARDLLALARRLTDESA